MTQKRWFYLFMGLHSGITLYLWLHSSATLFTHGGILLALGRICGLLLATLAAVQLLLMSRAPWLEPAFGLDRLARWHHLIGKYFLIPLILHPLLVISYYASSNGIDLVSQFLALLKYEDIPKAVIGFLLFLSIIIYSLLTVWRGWNFERWYYVHLAMYLAVILALGHQLELGGSLSSSSWASYYWYGFFAFVACNLAAFRFATPLRNFYRHRFIVSAVQKDGNVTHITINGRGMTDFRFLAGQFVIVRFLQPGFYWQAHPFTLSQGFNGHSLRLSIKGIGDFSRSVSSILPGTRVVIEGPYGTFTARRGKGNKFLLIAGGIGITPLRGIMEDLGKLDKDVVLMYGNKTVEDIALRVEIENLSQQYHIPLHHVLSNVANLPSQLATRNSQLATSFHPGFITPELIKQFVPDAAAREVFLCGPPAMMSGLIKSLPSIGIPKSKIYAEKFSL